MCIFYIYYRVRGCWTLSTFILSTLRNWPWTVSICWRSLKSATGTFGFTTTSIAIAESGATNETNRSIPHATEGVSKAIDLRKNGERAFNLLKKREGLEYARVRGQHNILAQSIFTTVATLLIEMAGTRKSTQPKPQQQLELLSAA
ncbi:MAG: hypothetical protein KFF68_08965 [Desulfosarcina sp.]|nr:hypothetical protein [Desulfosarcina sp.]